ncbi:MAG: Lrp/AsnC family transcriptional regulator [Chloroflexota bacterium]|nr:Lrp/AsnC family transcriptional regulator [Chloroflexota bacterium]
MDELDVKILQFLQEDGRTPFTKIAKNTGVSESTIRSRYATLIEKGVVHTVSIVDPFVLGFEAPAIIGVSVDIGNIDKVAKAIVAFPEVSYLVMVLGNYDIIVEVFCHDISHLVDLITNGFPSVPGIRETETLVIGKSYKLSYRWSPRLDDLQ